MKMLFPALLIVAAAGGYWTFGMTPEQRVWVKAKILSVPEWRPVSISD